MVGSASCSIHVNHHQMLAVVIQKAAEVLACATVLDQIVLEELKERITARATNSGQEATDRGPMRQLLAAKERHKMCKRGEPVKSGFEGGSDHEHLCAGLFRVARNGEIPAREHDAGRSDGPPRLFTRLALLYG
jgi:hypothetical protein